MTDHDRLNFNRLDPEAKALIDDLKSRLAEAFDEDGTSPLVVFSIVTNDDGEYQTFGNDWLHQLFDRADIPGHLAGLIARLRTIADLCDNSEEAWERAVADGKRIYDRRLLSPQIADWYKEEASRD